MHCKWGWQQATAGVCTKQTKLIYTYQLSTVVGSREYEVDTTCLRIYMHMHIDTFDFLPTKLRMHNAHVHMYCVFERSLSTEHLWKLIDYSNKHKSIIDLTHSIESEKSITMK